MLSDLYMSLAYMPKGVGNTEESVSQADTPVKGAGTFVACRTAKHKPCNCCLERVTWKKKFEPEGWRQSQI